MEPEDIIPEPQPDETHVISPDDKGTVGNVSDANNLILDELNSLLGKNFKDKATALKSVKDTYSYVGKRKEDITKELSSGTENVTKELKEIKSNMFFDKNPDYVQYRSLMEKMGDNPVDVANMPEFKGIFEKAVGYDKNQNLKSVLVSNPRLAMSKDNLTKAREATSVDERERLATQAVLDSIGA